MRHLPIETDHPFCVTIGWGVWLPGVSLKKKEKVTEPPIGTIVRLWLISKFFNLCGHDPPALQTDGRHAIARPHFALQCIAWWECIQTGFMEFESGFRFANWMAFFTESETSFTMKPNLDSVNWILCELHYIMNNKSLHGLCFSMQRTFGCPRLNSCCRPLPMTTLPPRIGTRVASAFNDNITRLSSTSRTLSNNWQPQHNDHVSININQLLFYFHISLFVFFVSQNKWINQPKPVIQNASTYPLSGAHFCATVICMSTKPLDMQASTFDACPKPG